MIPDAAGWVDGNGILRIDLRSIGFAGGILPCGQDDVWGMGVGGWVVDAVREDIATSVVAVDAV